MTAIEFKTSSFCSGGECVEVGMLPQGGVAMRDTKDRTRHLEFSSEEWAAFVAEVKNGSFDGL
jgi:Domain of unknown function (DUF397)